MKSLLNYMEQLELVYSSKITSTRFGEDPFFEQGLYDLKNDIYSWMVPNGSWGESNAGLIVGENESLLVDTLWDLHYTQQMLNAMSSYIDKCPVKYLVNSHADGDHFWGNELVNSKEIIASKTCNEELTDILPKSMLLMEKLGQFLSMVGVFKAGEIGHWFKGMGAPYDFKGITHTPATKTFQGEMILDVGGREVRLIEVGPAHTKGDTLVYIPDSKTLFAGDILFIGSTPVMWAGPYENILKACDLILDLDVDLIVPGHGPVTDKKGVELVKQYWQFVYDAVLEGFNSEMNEKDTATKIALSQNFAQQPFSSWNSPERIMTNTYTIFRHLKKKTKQPGIPKLISMLSKQAILAHKLPNAQPLSMRKV